jgi:hypothetical protein
MNVMFCDALFSKEIRAEKYLCFIFTTDAEVGRFAQGIACVTNNKSEHGARRTAFKGLAIGRRLGE